MLARVKQDLADGHTYLATRRLRTLLAVDPADLEVRGLLAQVYRESGNPVEAGRWGYLTADVREDEIIAFDTAHPSAWIRLRLLRWAGEPRSLPSKEARQRLRDLIKAAEAAGPPERWQGAYALPDASGSKLPCLFVAVALTLFGILALIGLGRAVAVLFSW